MTDPTELPSGFIRVDVTLAQEDAAKLARRFQQAMNKPPVLLSPVLRRRTRLRLAATRRIDKGCCWLIDHRCYGAAVLIWRVCGLWR